jgi:hypothetical protein
MRNLYCKGRIHAHTHIYWYQNNILIVTDFRMIREVVCLQIWKIIQGVGVRMCLDLDGAEIKICV